MWLIILFVVILITIGCVLFCTHKLNKFLSTKNFTKNKSFSISLLLVLLLFIILALSLKLINAVICILYLTLICLCIDSLSFLLKRLFKYQIKNTISLGFSFFITILVLNYGWYLDHEVWKTEYNILTTKNITPIKIAFFADSHIGATFDAKGLSIHLEQIQKENPDTLFIIGDYVDDDSSKEDMIKASQLLGNFKTKYGVYFVFGNHDKGYYGAQKRGFSSEDLIQELTKNNITVLRDQEVTIKDNIVIFGRLDYSVNKELNGTRKTMNEIVKNYDYSKYSIILDHQPTDYKNQQESQVDLVLSGHTHGGQLFPFNYVGKWIGAIDAVYGLETRDKTNFIVTSGISDWAIKFKTGTKSEFVIINIQK